MSDSRVLVTLLHLREIGGKLGKDLAIVSDMRDVRNRRLAAPHQSAAFNPLSRNERMLFEVLLAGEHAPHGFTNRDVRQKLRLTAYPLTPNEDMHSGRITRLFRRLHAQGPHRQNPSFAPLLGFPRRSKDHVHRDQTPGGRLPQPLRNRRLIVGISSRNTKKIRRKDLRSAQFSWRESCPPAPRSLPALLGKSNRQSLNRCARGSRGLPESQGRAWSP